MKIEAWKISVLVAVLTLGRGPAAASGSPPQKKDEPSASKFLLRKDLLAPKQKEFVMPKRNLFSTMSYESAELPQTGKTDQNARPPGDVPEIRETVNFRYIGYIKSDRSVTAVVIMDGLPYPVAVGDVLGQGIIILKITPVKIEIQGPDSVKKTFTLEGERE